MHSSDESVDHGQLPVSQDRNDRDIYAPLPLQENEIRVLTLHAGDLVEPLECTLQIGSLTDATTLRYETISYTWGSSQREDAILINDSCMEVPRNTFRALRSVRSLYEDRRVWIDFVCINQEDLSERNVQVSLMANIYQKSHCNLIYLGEDNIKATAAFASIESLASEAEAEMELKNVTLDELLFPNGYFAFSDKPIACETDVEALAWIYQLPWFRRHWVFQEAGLSPHSIAACGHHTIDFDRIMKATAWLEHKSFVVDDPTKSVVSSPGFRGANNMQLIRANLTRFNSSHPFADLLEYSPFGEATDVRDQVFGLIGLYQASGGLNPLPSALQPDYRKSIPDTLRDATRYAIEEGKRLSILERQPLKRPRSLNQLPGWVPEWFRPFHSDDARALTYTAYACSTHEKWSVTTIRNSQDPNILCIQGLQVDTVSQISDTATLSNLYGPHSVHTLFSSWQMMAESADQSIENLGRTVLGGEWWTGVAVTPNQAALWPIFLQHQRSQCDVCPSSASSWTDNSAEEQKMSGFFTALSNACRGRRFFTTASGRIGIGPVDIQVGDDICILQGGRLPFVLRREGDYQELIGPTYTHGIMFGEAIDKYEGTSKDAADVIFNIK